MLPDILTPETHRGEPSVIHAEPLIRPMRREDIGAVGSTARLDDGFLEVLFKLMSRFRVKLVETVSVSAKTNRIKSQTRHVVDELNLVVRTIPVPLEDELRSNLTPIFLSADSKWIAFGSVPAPPDLHVVKHAADTDGAQCRDQ